MGKKQETIQPINTSFDEAVNAVVPREESEEITLMSKKINILTLSKGKMEITSKQGVLDLGIERERDVEGIGMGVLSDGTPYLSQRGLASLCGVQNAHIGTISSQWDDEVQKPRITTVKGILSEAGSSVSRPHIEVLH